MVGREGRPPFFLLGAFASLYFREKLDENWLVIGEFYLILQHVMSELSGAYLRGRVLSTVSHQPRDDQKQPYTMRKFITWHYRLVCQKGVWHRRTACNGTRVRGIRARRAQNGGSQERVGGPADGLKWYKAAPRTWHTRHRQ